MLIEAELLSVIEAYLDSRAIRFPGTVKRKTNAAASPLSQHIRAGRSSASGALTTTCRTNNPEASPSLCIVNCRKPPLSRHFDPTEPPG